MIYWKLIGSAIEGAANKITMEENTEQKPEFGLNVEEMARAGLHFGHRASRAHPKMAPYLYGVRNTVHIIDLEKTKEKLAEALKFIEELVSGNKVLLIVGTKVQTKQVAKDFAKELNFPYIIERWIGGTFTNFETIKKRVEYFRDLEKKKETGELDKYTKKEKIKIGQELGRLEIKFGGIKNMDKIPDAILILNIRKDALAVKEAREKNVKIIGISDTNTDPTLVDYPIPANDDAISSAKYILDKMKEVILNVKSKSQNEK